MDSFFILTDDFNLKECLLQAFSTGDCIINEHDGRYSVTKPGLKYSKSADQYVICYTQELDMVQIDQFEEFERQIISAMGWEKWFVFSVDFNHKSVNLLSYLIDISSETILAESKSNNVLIQEDIQGRLYRFPDFHRQWKEWRGFFLHY